MKLFVSLLLFVSIVGVLILSNQRKCKRQARIYRIELPEEPVRESFEVMYPYFFINEFDCHWSRILMLRLMLHRDKVCIPEI